MRKLTIYAVALVCLGQTSALSLSDRPYLVATDADFGNLLPPPPVDGSVIDQRDMQAVLDTQKRLTPEWVASIRADVEYSIYRFGNEIFGPSFTKDRYPLVGAFFDKINNDSRVGVRPIKDKYKRLRPSQANKEVKILPDVPAPATGPTYPSGHCTFGAQSAFLLSMMVPEKKTELFARGWQFGEQRIASGLAYPSDCEGGRIGAAVMVTLMLQKPEFKADFEAVKAEIRRGIGLAP
jgi:acid phosphatase (class A)